MEEAYKAGKLRAIGVSNFYPDRLIDLCQFAEIKPAVNQVETHALFQQQHAAHEVHGQVRRGQHESWGPFAEGRKDFFTNPTLHGHRRQVRQVRRPDRPALSDPERRGGHPQVHPQGADGAEPGRL